MPGKLRLKAPCKNCPFADRSTRITFACRERAEEIEELAYRQGFPCHLSAELHEPDDDVGGSYEFGANTQHCAGAVGMFLNGGYDTFPGIENRTLNGDWSGAQKVAFESPEAFINANLAKDDERVE